MRTPRRSAAARSAPSRAASTGRDRNSQPCSMSMAPRISVPMKRFAPSSAAAAADPSQCSRYKRKRPRIVAAFLRTGVCLNFELARAASAAPPLPLGEHRPPSAAVLEKECLSEASAISDRAMRSIVRCDPGEGLRPNDRPEPLTPTLSLRERGARFRCGDIEAKLQSRWIRL